MNKIRKGNKIKCKGIGYPHWKDMEFICEIVFENNTIGLNNKIRVSVKDFVIIEL